MSKANVAALSANEVKSVSLHYGLKAYVLDLSKNWGFLQSIRNAQGNVEFSKEPSTQINAAYAQNATVSCVDAANEAARVLFDNKVELAQDHALVLFQDQSFIGAYVP